MFVYTVCHSSKPSSRALSYTKQKGFGRQHDQRSIAGEAAKRNNNVLNSCELLNLSYLASLSLLWAQVFVFGLGFSKVRRSTKPHITSPRSRSPKLSHLERDPHIHVTWFNVSKNWSSPISETSYRTSPRSRSRNDPLRDFLSTYVYSFMVYVPQLLMYVYKYHILAILRHYGQELCS
jgi:hypothetical protein